MTESSHLVSRLPGLSKSIHSSSLPIARSKYPVTRFPHYAIRAAALLLACATASASCKAAIGELTARASDEWTRTYPLGAEGEVQVVNANGIVDVEGVEGSMVEVRAQRIARGATEAVARELLPRIGIKEDVGAGRISIETERIAGLLIGASFTVDYRVRAPVSARIRAKTVNGPISVRAIAGRVVLNTTNGAIVGRELSGGVEARTVNGRVEITLRSVGNDLVDLRTVNGAIDLAVPRASKANLSASVVNGPIETTGMTLELLGEQTRRRVRGRLNGGGTPVELATVNGRIQIAGQ